ncbi:ATP-binding cassette, sub-B (MDR TAP), member 8 [Sparganum proliferum]
MSRNMRTGVISPTRSGHTLKFDETEILARGDNRVSRELLDSWFTGPQSINKCNDLPILYSVLRLRLGEVISHAGGAQVNTVPNARGGLGVVIVLMNFLRGTVSLLRGRFLPRPANVILGSPAKPSFSRQCKAHLKKYKVTYVTVTLGVAGAGIFSAVTVPKLAFNCKFLEPIPVSAEVPPPSLPTNKTVSDETGDTNNSPSIRCVFALTWADLPFILMALLGAFGAAYFNIRIPLLLGDLVNMLAELSRSPNCPLSSLRAPSVRLCGAYSLQSLCTFAYIGFLATVGERVASRLRCMLFERLIFRRVTFFDKTTTSWLLDRTVADVQAFKSAFKASISQGLRSGAQIIGSTVAMYMISPTLSAALVGCLPLVFLVGSLIGHQLRILSHKAQDQDDIATEVASETFMHIRSVKSLTMEPTMMASYTREVTHAGHLHELLGYGIGCFQGLSNFVLNGVVLGVLYLGGNLIARNELEAGQLMSFLVATQSVHRSLAQISLLFGSIVRGMSAATRLAKVVAMIIFIVLTVEQQKPRKLVTSTSPVDALLFMLLVSISRMVRHRSES